MTRFQYVSMGVQADPWRMPMESTTAHCFQVSSCWSSVAANSVTSYFLPVLAKHPCFCCSGTHTLLVSRLS